jgi:hypothetical protein
MEEGIGHPQGLEDALAQELVKALVGYYLDDSPQSVKRRTWAVAPLRAGLKVERRSGQAWNVVGQLLARLPGNLGDFGAAGSAAAGKAGDVGQQVLYGDLSSLFPGLSAINARWPW